MLFDYKGEIIDKKNTEIRKQVKETDEISRNKDLPSLKALLSNTNTYK